MRSVKSPIVDEAHRPRLSTRNLRVLASFLVDGIIRGTWRIERARKAAALVLDPFEAIPAKARDALRAEGTALLRFAEPDAAAHEVRFAR